MKRALNQHASKQGLQKDYLLMTKVNEFLKRTALLFSVVMENAETNQTACRRFRYSCLNTSTLSDQNNKSELFTSCPSQFQTTRINLVFFYLCQSCILLENKAKKLQDWLQSAYDREEQNCILVPTPWKKFNCCHHARECTLMANL